MEPRKREVWRKPDTGDFWGGNKRNKYLNLLSSLLPISCLDCLQKNSEPFPPGKSNFGACLFPLQHVPWRFSCHPPCFSDHHLHLDISIFPCGFLKLSNMSTLKNLPERLGYLLRLCYFLSSSLLFNFWFVKRGCLLLFICLFEMSLAFIKSFSRLCIYLTLFIPHHNHIGKTVWLTFYQGRNK